MLDLLRDVDVGMPDQLTGADLLVRLEGNVSVKHVVEQDSQAPDCKAVTRVLLQYRPLRWGIDSGALELRVDQGMLGVLGRTPTARPEVYQLGLPRLEINQHIFILKEKRNCFLLFLV